MKEKARRKGPLDALPDMLEDWAVYDVPEEVSGWMGAGRSGGWVGGGGVTGMERLHETGWCKVAWEVSVTCWGSLVCGTPEDEDECVCVCGVGGKVKGWEGGGGYCYSMRWAGVK